METTRRDRRHESSAPGTRPDITQLAAAFGLDVSPQEMRSVERSLENNLAMLTDFLAEHSGSESSMEVVDGYRTFRLPSAADDPLNAWLSRCSISGPGGGILAGKTISFKDTIAVAGLPLTYGAGGLDGYIPKFDATVVRRALRESATIVGKNTILGGFGEPGTARRPRNPHAPDHLTGGSSAGSAIAVVIGDVDVAYGGDQGGSVRVPAAWCGAVGLKPTFGLVSNFGVVSGADQSVDHVGPIARTVEDTAAALQAVAGYDPLDPRQRQDVPPRVDVLRTLRGGVAGMRIGLLAEGFAGADNDVADLVRSAADVYRRAGAVLRDVSVPEHRQILAPYLALSIESARATLTNASSRQVASTEEKYVQLMGEAAWQLSEGRAYAVAHNVRPKFIHAYDSALQDVDLLLMPTCLFTAPKFTGRDREIVDFPAAVHNLGLTNTLPFNYTGHPALSVPCGKSNGLPVGLQLVGRRFGEASLLRAGWAFQESVAFAEFTAVVRS